MIEENFEILNKGQLRNNIFLLIVLLEVKYFRYMFMVGKVFEIVNIRN